MELLYTSLALGMIAACGAFIAIWSLMPAAPSNADLVEGRLRVYETGLPVSVAEMELQVPFGERIVRPAIKRFGRLLEQTMPEKVRQQIHLDLYLAGRPGGLSTSDFIAIRYLATGLFCCLGIGIGLLTRSPVMIAVGAAVGALVGLYLPTLWLRRRVTGRRREIQSVLPDVLDVLVVCVEAGLTFEAAVEKVGQKYDHALGEEFVRVLQEIRLGKPRLEALNDMAQRCGVEELNSFVQAVIQSEQLGSGIVKVLRIQSDEIRNKRLLMAQERGARASLKMLIPMVGCIFPTLWVILLGPALILLMHSGVFH
ncbi:MAG TPA: type II secretion system F family protein [Candidatus Dormibacteraeota bacterium]|nr:type II secretion system F family protein [Candidatus Dormibacteraeota bacterium]